MRFIAKSLLQASALLSLPGVVAQGEEVKTVSNGLKTSVAADFTGKYDLENKADNDKPAFGLQSLEISLYGPIDHLFNGMLNLAVHKHGDEYELDVEEATIGTSKLIPHSQIKAGLFLLGVGKLNPSHPHDWPFISAPYFYKKFFSSHGISDTGVEYSFLVPLSFYLNITAGVTNGWKPFVHSHHHHDHEEAEQAPLIPTHYTRFSSFTDLPGSGGLEGGLNYLGRLDHEGSRTLLFGADFTAKWRSENKVAFLLQGEGWYRVLSGAGEKVAKDAGFYIFPQAYLGYNLEGGLRLDGFAKFDLDKPGFATKRNQVSGSALIGWRPSEFSLFRLGYTVTSATPHAIDSSREVKHIIESQIVFNLGEHQAHDF